MGSGRRPTTSTRLVSIVCRRVEGAAYGAEPCTCVYDDPLLNQNLPSGDFRICPVHGFGSIGCAAAGRGGGSCVMMRCLRGDDQCCMLPMPYNFGPYERTISKRITIHPRSARFGCDGKAT